MQEKIAWSKMVKLSDSKEQAREDAFQLSLPINRIITMNGNNHCNHDEEKDVKDNAKNEI